MNEIKLIDAIRQMEDISREGGTFSFSHRKYDRHRAIGGDLATIPHARLRPQAKDEQVADATYKIFYTDCDTGLARIAWQPLIVQFNGMTVTI